MSDLDDSNMEIISKGDMDREVSPQLDEQLITDIIKKAPFARQSPPNQEVLQPGKEHPAEVPQSQDHVHKAARKSLLLPAKKHPPPIPL